MKQRLTALMARIETAKRLPMLAKASAIETIINEAVALLALLVAEVEHLKQQLNDQRKGQDHGNHG